MSEPDRDAWMAGFMAADAIWREQYQGALLDQQDADLAYTMWCSNKLADAAVEQCRQDMRITAPDAPTRRLAHREGCACRCREGHDKYGLPLPQGRACGRGTQVSDNLVDALVYTLERETFNNGHELLSVLRTRRGTELAVADYWARPGYSNARIVVRAWRLGVSVAGGRFVFRGDRGDWVDGLGDGPRWTELDR